eukprot:CAMPEP_0176139308 /NCGR_PEP_ID=MMETSP0120_2-20121206/70779_1 /TAXON_ID=160619 /ORGANISM="Kryptoperidinium foliaceum, Strain CCMP 1326" /LENGTH=736 /DNA_ID=CAMNT_0017475291 /DNA_START=40 /DNA_END=2250 /DNA_ORIENTATION=-
MAMAPLAEHSSQTHNTTSNTIHPTMNFAQTIPLRKPGSDRKTVAYAFNYEPSLVDRFVHRKTDDNIDSQSQGDNNSIDSKPNSVIVEDDEQVSSNAGTTSTNKRRSTREQKQRTVAMTPVKVRYDMESVPLVDRPKMSFWDDVKVWPPRSLKDPPPPIMSSSTVAQPQLPNSTPAAPTPVPPSKPIRPDGPLPNSVLWKPTKRKDWEDSVSEMTAVCTSAALRKHPGPASKFVPPLSKEYIRDRIDIDDPLRGYQIRHAVGGWLQGFCLWTNFTTWTHHFEWNSTDPRTGLLNCEHEKDDGTLSKELEALPRSGCPTDAGIVFENIAEIALLGGLGCGELLLRMALEDILKNPQYKYVILQATNGSRAFYERFGFVRVGAICRYSSHGDSTTETPLMNNENVAADDNLNTLNEEEKKDEVSPSVSKEEMSPAQAAMENPIQGYRHWTHHNESQHSLELHGGPSYMMCLKLPEEPIEGLNLLEKLADCFVEEKPRVEQIGSTTPTSKRKLKRSSSIGNMTPPFPHVSAKPSPSFEDFNANKRRKVSMDKLDLGEAALSHGGYGPYSTSPTSSRRSKAYSQLVAKAVAGSTPKGRSRGTPKKSFDLEHSTPYRPQATPTKGIQKVDRATLVKQKVKSYPRDREHFYNKVVQPKGHTDGPYFFVLNYNEKTSMVTLCPMAPRGLLSGKRAGRPRYQCVLGTNSSNWITAPCDLYDPVPAFMVMKTPLIAQEAWDINAES